MKALATAVLLVFAGTSLMVWHWNDRSGASAGLPVAQAGTQVVPEGTSDPDLSLLPIEGQTFAEPQLVAPGDEAATPENQAVVPSAPIFPGDLPETGVQRLQANQSSFGAQSGREPLALVDAGAGAVKASATESKPAPAAPGEQPSSAVADPADPWGQKLAEVLAAAGKHGPAESASPAPARSGDKPVVVASVEPDSVKPPAAKGESLPAPTPRQQAAVAVVSGGRIAKSSPVDEAVERAGLALSEGQYEQALAALDKLSPVPERRGDFWLMKGSAHLGLGQFEAADKAFESAQGLAPDDAQIAVQRAVLQQEQGDHASALKVLDDAATRHPDVPEIALNRGYSQQELGAVRDAARSYRAFLRMTRGRSLYAEQRRAIEAWLAQLGSVSE